MLNCFKIIFYIIVLTFLINNNVIALGLDAKTGILEWSCKTPPSGRSFKRPPINIKFNGKRFTGEVKFYSDRRS